MFALERHPSILYGATAMASAAVGLMVARAQVGISLPLVALAGLALILVMLSVPPPTLFVGWFLLAPLLASASASPIGKPLGLALYALPAAVLAILTATHYSPAVSLSFVDFLPAAYVVYAVTSIAVTSPTIEPSVARSVEVVFLIVALGPCLYYFLVVGPGVAVKTPTVLRVLMAGACVEAVLALIETATAWTPWGTTTGATNGGLRAVATLENPAVLGAYLGIGVAIAAAILAWDGPHSLRRLARLTLVLCIPALVHHAHARADRGHDGGRPSRARRRTTTTPGDRAHRLRRSGPRRSLAAHTELVRLPAARGERRDGSRTRADPEGVNGGLARETDIGVGLPLVRPRQERHRLSLCPGPPRKHLPLRPRESRATTPT